MAFYCFGKTNGSEKNDNDNIWRKVKQIEVASTNDNARPNLPF